MRKLRVAALLLILVFSVFQVTAWADEIPVESPEQLETESEPAEAVSEDNTEESEENGTEASSENQDPSVSESNGEYSDDPEVTGEPLTEEEVPCVTETTIAEESETAVEPLTGEAEDTLSEQLTEEDTTAVEESTENQEQTVLPEEDLTLAETEAGQVQNGTEELPETAVTEEPDTESLSTEDTIDKEDSAQDQNTEETPVVEKITDEDGQEEQNVEKPAQPVLGSISSVDTGLKLTWKKVNGAEGYNLYFWHTEKKKYVKFASTTSTSYIDTAAKIGKRYYYTVTAYNKAGESEYDYNGILGAYVPATSVTSLENAEKGLTLKWKEVGCATGYRIYWRTGTGKWHYWKDVNGAVSLSGISGQSGLNYEYMVIPYMTVKGNTFEGAYNNRSSKTVTYLGVPSLKSAKAVQNGVQLKWGAVSGAKGYKIYYWNVKSKKYIEFATTTSTSYVDTKARSGVRYWYTVAAYTDDTTGAYTYAGIQGLYLPASRITKLKGTATGLTLAWTAVNGASGYRVYWRYLGGTWKTWKDVTVTSLSDISFKADTAYEYCIVPYKTVKNTKFLGYWDNNSCKTIQGLPATPSLVSATSSAEGITIAWNAVPGATSYYLYWKPLTGSQEWKYFAETTSTQYLDRTAAGKSGFYYTVRAVNANGAGKYNPSGIMGTGSEVIAKATALLNIVGWDLRAAYNWSAAIDYTRNYTGMTTATAAVYAFNNSIGDCIAKASSFYWMAKVLGYNNVRVIFGAVPYANGGFGDHAWVEIDQGGQTYVCDPDFEWDEGRNGYFITYGQSGTWVYKYGYIMSDF